VSWVCVQRRNSSTDSAPSMPVVAHMVHTNTSHLCLELLPHGVFSRCLSTAGYVVRRQEVAPGGKWVVKVHGSHCGGKTNQVETAGVPRRWKPFVDSKVMRTYPY
jgi:hypothetical protein